MMAHWLVRRQQAPTEICQVSRNSVRSGIRARMPENI